MKQRRRLFVFIIPVIASIIVFGIASSVQAKGSSGPSKQGIDTDTCLACHASPGLQTEMESGEILYLTIDADAYNSSVHGSAGYACVQCHTNISGFPHPKPTAETLRGLSMQLYTSCTYCHQDKYEATLDSVHAMALAAGNAQAAICTDCHGVHDISSPNEPRSKIPQTCQLCHSQIYNIYEESVHGEALIGEGNPDVPSCIDCHGVHNVEGPSSGSFHDCHGVHDIRATDNPDSRVIQENLLSTCQRCHPDATANFPSAWLKHYQQTPDKAPLVFGVNLFYTVMIPSVIGGMILYISLDGFRRIANKLRRRRDG
jgi:Zn-finger protein